MPIDTEITVLVVEDFKATRIMVTNTLNALGYQNVLAAENGAAAVAILRETPVSLIVSDWNMPEMDGYELLLWVREDEKCRDIPFIMATARGEKQQMIKAVMAGVSHFIAKPFTAEELGKVIAETFEKKQRTTQALESVAPAKARPAKVRLKIAHIQITDHLALGALRHLIDTERLSPRYFTLETECMSGWNPVQKALETGAVDGALVLAPIAMDLFAHGAPIRMILLAHQNGSICVRKRGVGDPESLPDFFRNKTFFIPHVLSIHHMLSSMFLTELGLRPGMVGAGDVNVAFEVVPPVRMPNFLKESPEACGFMVAQPVGKKAIAEGGADPLFLSGDMWESHPCCVVAMRRESLDANADAIHEFSEMLAAAGRFIHEEPHEAARMAAVFLDPDGGLNLDDRIIGEVLAEPNGIRTDNLFPALEDLDRIQRHMSGAMGFGGIIDLERFVDMRFAEAACGSQTDARRGSVFHPPAEFVRRLMSRPGGAGAGP